MPASNGNNFELKARYISMLPKFSGEWDAYLFVREIEEVCVMIKLQQLSDDAIKLKFISFALKDGAKKWLYSLPIDLISMWNNFVKVFLKKYFPNHKTQQLRKEINGFKQVDSEPFWKCLERFKDLLAQYPHHGVEKWRLCQIVYEG